MGRKVEEEPPSAELNACFALCIDRKRGFVARAEQERESVRARYGWGYSSWWV